MEADCRTTMKLLLRRTPVHQNQLRHCTSDSRGSLLNPALRMHIATVCVNRNGRHKQFIMSIQ
jgi:hypothetical protein